MIRTLFAALFIATAPIVLGAASCPPSEISERQLTRKDLKLAIESWAVTLNTLNTLKDIGIIEAGSERHRQIDAAVEEVHNKLLAWKNAPDSPTAKQAALEAVSVIKAIIKKVTDDE